MGLHMDGKGNVKNNLCIFLRETSSFPSTPRHPFVPVTHSFFHVSVITPNIDAQKSPRPQRRRHAASNPSTNELIARLARSVHQSRIENRKYFEFLLKKLAEAKEFEQNLCNLMGQIQAQLDDRFGYIDATDAINSPHTAVIPFLTSFNPCTSSSTAMRIFRNAWEGLRHSTHFVDHTSPLELPTFVVRPDIPISAPRES